MKKINLSLIVLFRWLFLVLLMTGCASGEVKQASVAMPDSEPVLTVKWLPPCSVEADAPYFSVDVDKDGNVSYLGGSQAKEIGHRFIKIERKDVQRLASVARALLRSSVSSRETAFHEKKVRDDGEDYSYCISLALRDGALKRDGRFTSDAGRTQTLIETIRSIINEERWVCPVRESYEIRSEMKDGKRIWAVEQNSEARFRLKGRDYCRAWKNPAIVLSIVEPTTCVSGHAVFIYPDGIIHYYANHAVVENGHTLLTDVLGNSFYTISSAQLRELAELIRGFNLKKMPLPFDEPGPSAQPREVMASDSEQILLFRQRLSQMVDIQFLPLPPDRRSCEGKSNRPGGSVAFFLDAIK